MFRFTRPVPRKFQRQRMRRAAWIGLTDAPAPIRCVVWDLSDDGARITAQHGSDLPDVFALILTKDGKPHRFCRVVWRRGVYLGVRFIEAAEAQRLSEVLPERRKSNVSPYWKVNRAFSPIVKQNAIATYSDLDARRRQDRRSRPKPR